MRVKTKSDAGGGSNGSVIYTLPVPLSVRTKLKGTATFLMYSFKGSTSSSELGLSCLVD